MEKFSLEDYTPAILKIATTNKVSNEEALGLFIANLTTMKEHYKGAPDLNYHALGQQWNSLLSKDKVAQKALTKARLSKYSLGGKKV